MIGDGAVHCIRSHQNKLTNSLVLALGRDHLQSILEAFGKLWTRRAWRDPTLDTDVILESKGAKQRQFQNSGNQSALKNWMISLHVHIYKRARGAHKIIIILQPPPTWQPSSLLGKGGANRHCSERTVVPKGCLFFYTSCMSLMTLKSWHLLLIGFIQFEIHMTKLLFKPTWINLASITAPSMCWTKPKYISREDKRPWLLSCEDMWLVFHWGGGGDSQ